MVGKVALLRTEILHRMKAVRIPYPSFTYGASTTVALDAAQMVQINAISSGKRFHLFGAASKAR